ncbi:potassium transporter Kup [Opitutus terrae]|uniref:Probable potassium transport system protein Kup n=1 Tax=Opitutus terrae (strain DSM 11246 / JCM 15787 / PB90-1) TaxID=452637 RepID=B1ZZJ2_OPITP|nr:KUP/HAK/KT family potassium transporter [Opitutus terrae]ACB76395.1 K potassium transporter [Opitutus terrae PB90-1]
MSHPSPATPGTGARIALGIGALGVVFGDIGTSPLYTMRECLHALPDAEPSVVVLGVLSLIVWSLIFIVSIKYTLFVLRADNRGEGGIFTLLALGKLDPGPRHRLTAGALLVLAGAAMLCGEAVITPAITVLGAVEGVKVVWPGVAHTVVPISCLILAVLFGLQFRGTKFIGSIFGPVMLFWFVTLGAFGLWRVIETPMVLQALNPLLGLRLLFSHPPIEVVILLGSVVLAFTGVEALYADMGHFGRRVIVTAWYGVVLPGLTLNYFGQGAYFLSGRSSAENPFLAIAPEGPLRYGLLALSVLAAIIASQALISGAYSLVRQAIQLGFFPRLTVRHTNAVQQGQIYLPLVNSLLAIGSIATVLEFRSSSALAAAYGIAVTGTMIITTIALFFVMTRAWYWSTVRAASICAAFLVVDVTFFSANLHKFFDGGWLPLGIATGVLAVMVTWKMGKFEIFRRVYANEITEAELKNIASSKHVQRVRGTGVFMAGNPTGTPLVLLHHVKATKVLHETVVLLSIITQDVPFVPDDERLDVREIGEGVWRALARYGYMESPDVSTLIIDIRERGVPLKPSEATYYFNREMIITGGEARMWEWQKRFYGFLSRNARQARDYYRLPPMQIIEVGLPIQL